MENRIKIEIAGNEIILVSDQDPAVMRKTADAVQERLYQMMGGNKTTAVAAILTCMNIMEDLEKEKDASDQLRRELTRYAQENAAYKGKMEEQNQEVERLKTELKNLKVDYQIRDTAVHTMGEKDEELAHALRELESVREGHHRFRQESMNRQESMKREIAHLKQLLQMKGTQPSEGEQMRIGDIEE